MLKALEADESSHVSANELYKCETLDTITIYCGNGLFIYLLLFIYIYIYRHVQIYIYLFMFCIQSTSVMLHVIKLQEE